MAYKMNVYSENIAYNYVEVRAKARASVAQTGDEVRMRKLS